MWRPAVHLEAQSEGSVGSPVDLSASGVFLDPLSAHPSTLVWVWSV